MDLLKGGIPEGAQADAMVERALFLAATGYSYTEERRETTEKDGDPVVKIVCTRKHTAPNMTAVALWLSRRMPEKWGEGASAQPENNLLALLRADLEGGERDAVPALQPQAEDGSDLVARPGAGEA